jgi:uncharacterized protein
MSLQFDWDEQKADLNAIKHGVSFTDLGSITIDDLEHSIDEDRYIEIGISDRGRLLVVVYTERGDFIRIISSRYLRVLSMRLSLINLLMSRLRMEKSSSLQ